MIFKIDKLDVYYGNIHALKEISLEVRKGEIVSIIGANGAGKTTTLRTISRLVDAKAGEMIYMEENIIKKPAQKLVKSGLVHVPEGRHVFADMTVKENLEMGAYIRNDRAEIKSDIIKIYNMFPRLHERKNQLAGTLSGGEQQMLALGRGLMSKPNLLLLDEPSMGLAPLLVKEIFNIIEKINQEEGITILLVEQNANMALKISHRAYVLETGRIVLHGLAKDIIKNKQVKEAYLG